MTTPAQTPLEKAEKALKIYVASSWRNQVQPQVVELLRAKGHIVYDFRNPSAGDTGFAWEQVDENWKQWTPEQYAKIIKHHPMAEHGFNLDKNALDWCDVCIIVLPCGNSAHLEAGYACGQGKQVIFYLSPDDFRPDLMYKLGDIVCDEDSLIQALSALRASTGMRSEHDWAGEYFRDLCDPDGSPKNPELFTDFIKRIQDDAIANSKG